MGTLTLDPSRPGGNSQESKNRHAVERTQNGRSEENEERKQNERFDILARDLQPQKGEHLYTENSGVFRASHALHTPRASHALHPAQVTRNIPRKPSAIQLAQVKRDTARETLRIVNLNRVLSSR